MRTALSIFLIFFASATISIAQPVRYSRSGFGSADTIPFTLGPNNAIHFKGKINDSELLDLIFDTGANMGVITENGRKKNALLDPRHQNSFEIGDVKISNSPATFVDFNGGSKTDGIVGYNVFQDKIVEINYDKQLFIIHDSADADLSGYTSVAMKWRGSNMFVPCRVRVDSRIMDLLVLFDTGSRFALSLTNQSALANRLFDLKKIGIRTGTGVNGVRVKSSSVILPALSIGGLSLPNVPADLELSDQPRGLEFNILGNDVLKRFNVVLDYRSGMIWLKKNGLVDEPYHRPFSINMTLIGAGVACTVALVVFIARRRKRLKTA